MNKVSVVMPVYNRLDAMILSLEGFKRQTFKDFEIIIADDGSKENIRDFILNSRDLYPFPIKHVWQEDKGFQKARISNMAIAETSADYIVFNDADCIPRDDFVEAHLSYRENGRYLVGRTVKMSEKFSNNLSVEYIAKGKLSGFNFQLFYDYLFGKTKFFEYSVRLKNDRLLDFILSFRKNQSIFGYNFSTWKHDLFAVNGFNEEFIRPNNEDGELAHRLNNYGLKPKYVIGRAISFHYYHSRSHILPDVENRQRSAFAKNSGMVRCKKGLDQHVSR